MTDPSVEPDQTSPEPEQTAPQADQPAPAEIDLNAFLHEQEQYSRDVNAEFEAMKVSVDSPEWTEWCNEMEAWNAAVAEAAERERAD